jgi:hypothetical protein
MKKLFLNKNEDEDFFRIYEKNDKDLICRCIVMYAVLNRYNRIVRFKLKEYSPKIGSSWIEAKSEDNSNSFDNAVKSLIKKFHNEYIRDRNFIESEWLAIKFEDVSTEEVFNIAKIQKLLKIKV